MRKIRDVLRLSAAADSVTGRSLLALAESHRDLVEREPQASVAVVANGPDVARAFHRLLADLPEVRAFRLEQKGRGRALRTVWSASDAPVLAYMDVDLSTDLNALLPLVAPLLSGHSDLAIGSRLTRGSSVVRTESPPP